MFCLRRQLTRQVPLLSRLPKLHQFISSLRLFSTMDRKDLFLLFDVDGTLTGARQVITPDMYDFLENTVNVAATVGFVGGSDLDKQAEQMGGIDKLLKFDYVFPENGIVAYNNGKLLSKQTIESYIGEEKLQEFLNYCLKYLSEIKIPVKRGTFIEYRTGVINVSPIGRNCSREERNAFEVYDKQHGIRQAFINSLHSHFPDLDLQYSIGGQISFDCFPRGWDKTYCLKYLKSYKTIHFFGDKTDPGGNDHEIFSDQRVIGHKVSGPEDTRKQIRELLNL